MQDMMNVIEIPGEVSTSQEAATFPERNNRFAEQIMITNHFYLNFIASI